MTITAAPTVYVGHDPIHGPEGTDVLVTVYPDGDLEVALRPGKDQTWLRWGPPLSLEDRS